MVDIFWSSLLHKCHITGRYVTCSLFIHNRNNGILHSATIVEFQNKTKGVHLLVAEGKSLPPPIIVPLHSFLTSLDLLNLSSSCQESKKVLGPFQCMQRMLYCSWPHREGIKSSTWGLPLIRSDLTSTQKLSWLLVSFDKFWRTNPDRVLMSCYLLFKPIYPKTCTIFYMHAPQFQEELIIFYFFF